MEIPGVNIYLAVLLAFVCCVMGTLAVRTAVQVFRLRNKRMSWRAGTLNGFPLFSTLFLGISITLAALMWSEGNLWAFCASVAYLFISVSWFISSYFSSKCYITDNGIVKNVNDPAQTVPWHQVRDFLEQDGGGDIIYVFMYTADKADNSLNFRRLELTVPQKYDESFKKLLSHKLGRRIRCYESSTIKTEYFD